MKKTGKRVVSKIGATLCAFILQGMMTEALLTPFAQGQTQDSAASSRVVVHAGKLLDVRSGKTLTDQAIVIEGGKIVSVGSMAQANRPSSDRFIDLGNATVLPGLTDAHTHLLGNPQDVGPQALSISIPRATLSGA